MRAALRFRVAMLAVLIAAIGRPASDQEHTRMAMTVGESAIIDTPVPIERVAMGYGDIAEASAIGPLELLVNAKAAGVTTLIVWQEGGIRRFFDISVAPSKFLSDGRIKGIKDQIEQELPGQNVDISFQNDTVFLRGTVKDLTSAERAVSIASTLGKTVNLLYVDVPPPEAQILLRVRFASVDRSLSSQLGLNIFSLGKTIGGTSTQQFSPPALSLPGGTGAAATLSDALNLFFFRSDLNLGATIEALEVKGLLQILAEPNVLAENGKPASFLAGGEFPFPSVTSTGTGTPTVSIQFREFGVHLIFTPTITPRGTIHMQVSPEVSALDFTNGLSVSGFNVPALTTRKMTTEVELSEGQSFAIGGLLDNRTTDTVEKIPFIGDLPILGKFFQSKSISKQNTELIVIVTPELVRPIPAGESVPQLNYTKPFLKPNTDGYPQTPGLKTTGPVPVTPPHPTMPVEKLIQSMQPVAAAPQPSASPTKSSATPIQH